MDDERMESENNGDSRDSAEKQQDIPDHPWPYLKEMFDIVGIKNDSWRMCCKLCQPKHHELLAFKNSPSNLKKHIERMHVNHMERYRKLTSAVQKRKSTMNAGPSPKQPKLWEAKRVSQVSVEKGIIDFVIQGLHPLSVVEQQGFRDLLLLLQPNLTIMSRGTLKNKVEKATQEMKNNLKLALKKVEVIATTTDCWTTHRRGFIGVTAHWIDSATLQRRCAALACKQLKGSHTFSALASALNDIHVEYNIRDKIVCTTTDNGSNFIKAFRVYGELDENNNPDTALQGARESMGGESDEEEGGDITGVEFVEAGTILDEDNGLEYQLPKHQRCACHLLNLISTADALKANENPVYKRLSRSAFSKCSSLWSKSSRSTTAAEIIEDNCKLQLLRPNETRWNSLFFAVERIVRIIKEQGEGAITAVCSALKIPMYAHSC
ncbi:uncharacterized protein LOC119773848 [Cyprinodon tularosa]|uniref:uncharacterized protein LOC119773848 n=1 Tax=Cyprinodon tularosa TaxID=77115 RepID=UPI0018E23032|nr:uncharacterized protein LOC119773848 [Cyprinodon tularosa]